MSGFDTSDPNAMAVPTILENGDVVKQPTDNNNWEDHDITCDVSKIGQDILAIFTTPRLLWADMMFCAQQTLYTLGIPLKWCQGVFWGQVMSRMLEEACKDRYKYVMVLDYDSVFSTDDVLQLYAIMESQPEVDALCPMQLRRGDGSLLATVLDAEGHEALILNRQVFQLTSVPIATGHFGCTLIRTKAIACMSRPLFKSEPNLHGEWESGKIDEDIWFWKNMRDSGLKVHMAPSVHIGHCEVVVTWADNRINPFYQTINEYNETGKPKNAYGSQTKVEVISTVDEKISNLERV